MLTDCMLCRRVWTNIAIANVATRELTIHVDEWVGVANIDFSLHRFAVSLCIYYNRNMSAREVTGHRWSLGGITHTSSGV